MPIPPKERCEQVLKMENFDVPPWTCPICKESGSRAHWVAQHVLDHLRAGQTEPRDESAERFKRIEVD